jgi:membrane protease YdiL (CAAX protease family)
MKQNNPPALSERTSKPRSDILKDEGVDYKLTTTNYKLISWSPALAVAFVIVTYFLSQIIASLVVAIWPAAHHWSGAHTDEWLKDSIYAQFFYVLLAEALVLLAVYLFLKLYRCDWRAIGFRRPKWSDFGWGLAFAPLYYLTYLVILGVASALVPSLNIDQSQELGFNPIGTFELVLTFISLVILPPLVEELLMRGYLYTSLKKHLTKVWAALITSVIFAAAHLQFGSGAPLLWVAAIDTFVLSLFLVSLRERTGSLWASMTLHATKNLVAFLSLFILHLS